MMTWLDHLCRHSAELGGYLPDDHGDPRRAFARHVGSAIAAWQQGIRKPADFLTESYGALLLAFVSEFLPTKAQVTLVADGSKPPRPLGLLLTRATANLLSAADTTNIPDELWRAELGPNRAVYVDIPHGALTLDAGMDKTDVLQLRSIIAAPYLTPSIPGSTLFIAQITDPGSEQGRGRVAGVLLSNGMIDPLRSPSGDQGDSSLRAPYIHPDAEQTLIYRAGTFLRLVLAYHFFGPKVARESVLATSTERLRAGKPRKEESLFALTRLNVSDSTGRPQNTISTSWSLTSKQDVSGHFKLQSHGPGGQLRKLIWVDAYGRGPDNAPVKSKAYRI